MVIPKKKLLSMNQIFNYSQIGRKNKYEIERLININIEPFKKEIKEQNQMTEISFYQNLEKEAQTHI
jgi:hypothetical protein